MQKEDMIVIDEFCVSHQVEVSFVQALGEHGLIEIFSSDEKFFITGNELPRLEQMVRLYQELNINPEGIDVINNLLERIEAMQAEMTGLKNKLNFYQTRM